MRCFLAVDSMTESHCWACMCNSMRRDLIGLAMVLYVGWSGGSSVGCMSFEISCSVRVWYEPVRLITMGMMSMSWVQKPCFAMAVLSGVYSSMILSWMSAMSESVEYLHSMICRVLLPVYFGARLSTPVEGFKLYPTSLIMSGLQCFGNLSLGRKHSGRTMGCVGWSFSASSSPGGSESGWGRMLPGAKSFTWPFPRSMDMMGQGCAC